MQRIRVNLNKLMAVGLMAICPLVAKAQTYSNYNHSGFDPLLRETYKPGSNIHTSILPLRLDEIDAYVSTDSLIQRGLYKPAGRLNIIERFIYDDLMTWQDDKGPISIRINPLFNFEMGKETYEGKTTWLNTRGLMMEGKIGKNFSFYTDLLESQGVFAGYIDEYIADRKIAPGQGRVKRYKDTGYDFYNPPDSYNAGNYFNFQLGFGKNFIGDGYRSLLLSDNTSSYPYFKMTTTFGKIKYLLMIAQFQQLDTLRNRENFEVVQRFPSKYGAFHYLTWNIGNRVSLGLFENVIWAAENEDGHRGVDMNYLIPFVMYRPIEYGLGSPDNMALGANLKVLLFSNSAFYAQVMIDEFKLDEIMSGDKWWANKQAFQFGFKSNHFVGIQNLDVQAEYNQARPYTYSHYQAINNYGHFNQELAHPLGANFREGISILRYRMGRWHLQMEGMYAIHGKDSVPTISYGGDIFMDNMKRPDSHGHVIGQGLKTTIFNGSGEVSFLINPKTNMNLSLGIRKRHYSNERETGSNTLLYFAFRTSLRNLYYDF